MELLQYKGYFGSVEVSMEDGVVRGKLMFVNDLVTYESESVSALRAEFEAAVDDYLETCQMLKKAPDQAFSGIFNVRVGPELHKRAAIQAAQQGIKLNALVVAAVEKYLQAEPVVHTHNHTHQIKLDVTMLKAQTAVGVAQQGFQFVEVKETQYAVH